MWTHPREALIMRNTVRCLGESSFNKLSLAWVSAPLDRQAQLERAQR